MWRELAVVALVSSGCSDPQPTATGEGTIEAVIDGDTVIVRIDGRSEHVRLIGVDTPETVSRSKPVGCYGKEASNFTKATLTKGTAVRLERDVEPRDAYNRLLAYVYRSSDGLFVNLALATGGYADALPFAPNITHADRFRAAVDEARVNGRGLWGACPFFGASVTP